MSGRIHVTSGHRVQTIEAVEARDGGLVVCSTLGTGHRLELLEIHIPASARPWLARMASGERQAGCELE